MRMSSKRPGWFASIRGITGALLSALFAICILVVPSGPASAQGLLDLIFGSPAPKPVITVDPRLQQKSRQSLTGDGVFAVQPKRGEIDPDGSSGGTFRTVCVRMCDGYLIPMSYATTRKNFYQDQVKCRASCGDDARLFYHRSPGGAMEDAMDLNGRAYSRIPNAFRFRKTLVEGCACRPPPWSDAEKARHLAYATGTSVPGGARLADATPSSLERIEPGIDPVSSGQETPRPIKQKIAAQKAAPKLERVAATQTAQRVARAVPVPPPVVVAQPPPSSFIGELFGFNPPSMGLGNKPKAF